MGIIRNKLINIKTLTNKITKAIFNGRSYIIIKNVKLLDIMLAIKIYI